jgi:hypothetical protein
MQSAPAPTPTITPEWHAERAAYHLYHSLRPADGLPFYGLTSGQRHYYRGLIAHARALTDLTPKQLQERA